MHRGALHVVHLIRTYLLHEAPLARLLHTLPIHPRLLLLRSHHLLCVLVLRQFLLRGRYHLLHRTVVLGHFLCIIRMGLLHKLVLGHFLLRGRYHLLHIFVLGNFLDIIRLDLLHVLVLGHFVVKRLGLEVLHLGVDGSRDEFVLGLVDDDWLFYHMLHLLHLLDWCLVDWLLGSLETLVDESGLHRLLGVVLLLVLVRLVGDHILHHMALHRHLLRQGVTLEEFLFLLEGWLLHGGGDVSGFLLEGLFGPAVDVLEGGSVGGFLGKHGPEVADEVSGVVGQETGEGVFDLVPLDLVVLPVVQGRTGSETGHLQHGHAQGEHVTLEHIVLSAHIFGLEGE